MNPKNPNEIEIMRIGGKMLAGILNTLAGEVAPGVKPTDISKSAAEQIKKAGMQPVVLGYEGFPDVICLSVNNEIVHGIPKGKPFADGDVVKLDLTLGYKSMVVDSALTGVAGNNTNPDVKRLIDGTKKSLEAGIAAIKGSGTRVGDIAAAVQNVLDRQKLGIVRDLVGHGVGYDIHEAPNIPNYGSAGNGPALSAGMTIAIEPMATLGDWHIKIAKDGWTIETADGSLGAHFEHTVLITEDGAEILTTAS
jgi:methionyl aminopeptidase